MVDLPEVKAGQPKVTTPTARALPTPSVFTPKLAEVKNAEVKLIEVQSPLRFFADAVNFAGDEANKIAKDAGYEAGLQAVSRDENGEVKVDKWPIFGDAAKEYRRGVEVAAVADGETRAKNDLLKMQKEFEFDPEGFQKAAGAYRGETVSQYDKATGDPRVGFAVGRAIDGMTVETYRGLLNSKERRDLAHAKDSLEAQIQTQKDELFAIATGGGANTPEFKQRLEKVGALMREMAGNPKLGISADRVNYELGQMGGELTVAAMGTRVDRILKEQGIEAAVTEIEKIRTDPNLKLTQTQRIQAESRLKARIQTQVNAQGAIDKGIAQEIGRVADLAAEGYEAKPERMAALRREVEDSGNPQLKAQYRVVEQIAPTIQEWRKSSPEQLERTLGALDKTMREEGMTPELMAMHTSGQKLLKSMREGIKNDPLGWSERSGALPVPPIDFASPDAPQQMRDRIARADIVAGHYGTERAYLRPAERQLLENVASQGGKPMLEIAKMLVDGFGERAPRVLAEISTHAPTLAHVGGLVMSGGSPAVVLDAVEAVRLQQDKEFKLPKWLDKPSDSIQAAQSARARAVYGDAFSVEPDTGRAAQETARAAFFTRAVRSGHDPMLGTGTKPDAGATAAYDRALQEAAGATYIGNIQFGGVINYKPGYWSEYKVMIPSGVKADGFRSVIGALRDEDVAGAVAANGKSYTARDFHSAVPVAVKGGYRFAAGDPGGDDPKWIRGADGRPFVLDLERMEPVLRKRAPAAYAGK